MTTIIISAVIIIAGLAVLALRLAKQEDEQIANIKRRLQELEKKENEDDIH